MKHIRNFSIIAHIDHGKSTLADRLLEITKTIETRKMREQVLDNMELERERGITIKMQPVRMEYTFEGTSYTLNLIDTPGHIDFSYEVSRALRAVEGCLLLVDSTQGVQAQTLTTLNMARELGLTIIPVLSKIDSPLSRKKEVKEEIIKLLSCAEKDIVETSGKTGEGVLNLIQEVIRRIPSPSEENLRGKTFRSLVFDFSYSNHKGIIVYMRVMNGEVRKNDSLIFKVAERKFTVLEVGIFSPEGIPVESLSAGEIGYIVTGIKESGFASVGDTVASNSDPFPPLPGYMNPNPVVFASVYPESQDDFAMLKQSLGRLRLSDASFSYEEESSGALGRGFRCGFLGMLHLEIITERLRREFNLNLVVTTPSITYNVLLRNGKEVIVYSPAFFPEHGEVVKVLEPWVEVKIFTPSEYLGALVQILYDYEAKVIETESFGDKRTSLTLHMPLRELMRNFFDQIKTVSSGFASMSYTIGEMREADVVRLDIFIAEEIVPAFTRVVARRSVEEEAKKAVEKLSEILPRQMFITKIQAQSMGRIISSHTLSAMKKDVTAKLSGGDISRKKKLWEKQKKGKKAMLLRRSKINIPHDVFLKMMRAE